MIEDQKGVAFCFDNDFTSGECCFVIYEITSLHVVGEEGLSIITILNCDAHTDLEPM